MHQHQHQHHVLSHDLIGESWCVSTLLFTVRAKRTGVAVSHNQGGSAEAEYDRLRGLARQEHDKRSSSLDKVSLDTWRTLVRIFSKLFL